MVSKRDIIIVLFFTLAMAGAFAWVSITDSLIDGVIAACIFGAMGTTLFWLIHHDPERKLKGDDIVL